MGENKKSFLIVGLGRFGTSLCEKLVELGQSVIGVDQLAGPVAEMSEKIDVAAQLDVSDESALIKVGAKEVDIAIVTIGASLENSILCTSILVDLGIPLVLQERTAPLKQRRYLPEWGLTG
jgi:trk system potassium uptake protein TrkA